MNMTKTTFSVISPDGVPIAPEPFASREEAEQFVSRWCERYVRQGYYAAVDGRIPLEELPNYLSIVESD